MKRTYLSAGIRETGAGYAVQLDSNSFRTPGGKELVAPGKELAEAIAREFDEQGETIRKEMLRLTQLACIAIDLAGERRKEVMDDILSYAETDLVSYRAGDIPDLIAEQASKLDPIAGWAKNRFGIELNVTHGLMPVTQPEANRGILLALLASYDEWRLAALASAVKSLGSVVLALALAENVLDAGSAFELAHLEELHETRKWGADEEKERKMQTARDDIGAANQFLKLIGSPDACRSLSSGKGD